ncbi:MAG: flagellar biosynthesis repressor FlbT [Parasulfuritortus sp.]|nr:flagellar biosynthesis repressor FlbT [Parasulfuritortus sp.]
MPLRLTLRPKEKFFLNGVVVVNGENRADLTLLNDAAILREKDIMTEDAADTVCKRIYFLLQLMYIDPDSSPDYRAKLSELLMSFGQVVPATVSDLDQIGAYVLQGDIYHAMKVARKLILIEKELMDNVR